MSTTPLIPESQATEIRRLAHDLSNALEIVVQANYLLSTAGLEEPAKQWTKLLDQGVHQTADISRELREYIRTHS